MASIGREGKRGELKRILYRDAAGKQQTLRLGKCPKTVAETARVAVEHLVIAKRHNSVPHPDAIRWLDGIDEVLYSRVEALELCQPRASSEVVTLADLLNRFEAAAAVKSSTRAAYRQTTESLRAILGADTPLSSITTADADNWRKSISEPYRVTLADGTERTKRLASATQAKRVHVARAIFKRAVRWGMVPSSPFAELRAGSQSNPDRARYVSVETIRTVLTACPDDEWRAIVGLSRFAGLRCPSEIVALRWGDVNWERGRLMVRSPKTAGHEGHAVRVVPIVPELREILQDLFDAAEPGTEAVVPRLRDGRVNLRTQFERIIANAGEQQWPRLFHALRASCATDWAERFPAHTTARWLGHSPLIAAQHYLQTRDAHFDLAAGIGASAEAATNPATQARPSDTNDEHDESTTLENSEDLVAVGLPCDAVESEPMGDTGLEPVTSRV